MASRIRSSAPTRRYPATTPFNFADTLPQPNPFNSYDVIEKTFTFYTEATFAGTNWSGNLGVRVVHTKTLAKTAQSVPVSLWTRTTRIRRLPTSCNTARRRDFLAGRLLHLGAALGQLQLLAGPGPAAVASGAGGDHVASRPQPARPQRDQQGAQRQPQLYYTGTAGLKPIKAWSADLSAEWYYQPHSALTAGVFGKKVTNDIYHRHDSQCGSGHHPVHRRTPRHGSGHALPMDDLRPGQWRPGDLQGRRADLAALPRQRPGYALEFTHTWTGNPAGASTRRRPPHSL